MKLRLYQSDDLKEILALFHETVHAVNIADYTKEQCDAWAPEKPDEIRWNKILSAHLTLVAIEGLIWTKQVTLTISMCIPVSRGRELQALCAKLWNKPSLARDILFTLQ